MNDINLLCLGCMKEKPSEERCPYCGFDLEKYEAQGHQLPPQTILNGKYILGKMLGEGGFGISYIGFDLNLQITVAIKEYFPSGLVSRNVTGSNTVTVFSNRRDHYEKGREKFLLEAQMLARFHDMPGIVSVKDFFRENGTAYIVMEYIDGQDFGHFLRRNGGRIEEEAVFTMMKPLILSLDKIHEQGLIHRDISPDNIMITRDSQVKLLDFGAARDVTDENKSLSIMLKPGYAPVEQYQTKGRQGPWTDIYALCATMYRAITGKKPEESMSRLMNDTLKTPTELGISMNPMREYVLLKGLEIDAQNRWQNMKALYRALYEEQNIYKRQKIEKEREWQRNQSNIEKQKYQKKNTPRRNEKTVLLLVILGALWIFIFALIMLIIEINKSGQGKIENQSVKIQSVIASDKKESVDSENQKEQVSLEQDLAEEEKKLIGSSIGKSQEIPDEICENMLGFIAPDNAHLFDSNYYSYLSIPYHNFEGGVSIGHMVVNNDLADEILLIFQELYEINYPIEKMELLDYYEDSIEPITKPVNDPFDEKLSRMNKAALADNNTFDYAFFLTEDSQLGVHAKGNGIDLNPRINPAKEKDIIPSNGAQYFDRNTTCEDEVIERAMIRKGNAVYNIFKKYGWKWGGDWESTPYYHHFYKN